LAGGDDVKKYFFISSALDEDTAAVRRFHADLEYELRAMAGANVGGVLGTRADTRAVDDAHPAAASELPAMVALCSDRYFEDGWCGLEWATFAARAEGAPGGGGADRPDRTGDVQQSVAHGVRPAVEAGGGLVPVLWRPLTKGAPRGAADPLEEAVAELGGPYARRGLLALLRSNLMGDGGYFAVVRALAAKVIAAQRLKLAPSTTRTVSPAFGLVATPPAGQACRTPTIRHSTASAVARSAVAAPVSPVSPVASGRRLRIAVSHVGADQEWADWVQGLLARDGHAVTQIRWNPARGERLAETAERIRREKADVVLVVLSRRYRAPHPERPGTAVLEQWELLADGGRLGERVIRVLVDHEPLPEPLRSSKTLDLSKLDPGQVESLREVVGPGRPTVPVRTARRELRRPGEPPPVWNVPAENEFFTGRDDELALVRDLLEKHGRVALSAEGGLPDMGETEVAIEYSHRYKLRYDTVWWISCHSRVRIRAELDELSRRLGKAGSSGLSGLSGASLRDAGVGGPGGPGGIGARRAGIAPAANMLLVCAGVADPASLGEFFAGVQGHVLVVADSVGDDWDGGTVHIGRLRRAESVLLLRDAATMVDPSTAALVAEALDDRPALVAETGRYLVRQEVSPEVCLRLLTMRSGESGPHGLQSHADEVVERRSGGDGPAADDARPHEEVGAGEVAAALGAGRAVAGRVRITERDVDSLLAELMRVDYINDPTNFRTWLATLETFLGRRPDIPDSAVLSSRLMAVVVEAAEQAGPGMLDAVARALEAVAPADRSVGRFRRLVETLSPLWNETPQAPSGDPQTAAAAAPAPPARARAVATGSAATRSEAGEASFYFFTSYARRDDRRLVQQFHERFQAELERKVRRSVNCTGFLDRLSMEGGAHWRVELRRALQSSPIMLALWSDDYFDSRWCGREFAVFAERVRRATKSGEPPPACILPLRWLRLQDDIPPNASGLQITSMDLGKNYDEMPLVDLMRQHPRIFQKYLIKLVDRVMSVTKAPLPSLDEKTAEQIQPAFGRQP
jgi:hypothetical protein